MRRGASRILIATFLLLDTAHAEPAGPGSTEHPAGLDPTRSEDPRGLSHLSGPRRSPAGWLYDFPRAPLRTKALTGPWEAALRLEWGVAFDTGSERETRYERYADRDDAIFLNSATLALEHKDKPLYLSARALGVRREDQAYALEAGYAGLWRLRSHFSSIRRHYATDARSLLDGVGTETQHLRSGLTPGGNTPMAIGGATAGLNRQAFAVTRDRSVLRVDLTPTPTLRLFSSYRFEDRDGARPFGGALGFPRNTGLGQWIESAEPVDAHTHEIDMGLEWAGATAQVNLRYGLSLFRNRVDSLRFENPFSLGDDDLREGRFALAPSNRAHQIEGDFAWSLPGRVVVGGSVSWSRHRQNESLLPPTVNSGSIGFGANALDLDLWNQRDALSRDRADARIDRLIAHAYAVWTPVSRLRLRATGRVEDHDDHTDYAAFNPLVGNFGYVSEDGALEATTPFRRVFQPGQAVSDNWRFRSIPTSYRKQLWELEADVRLLGKTRLRAGVERRTVSRNHRARHRTREVATRVELTSRDLKRLTLRAGYDTASRVGSPYDQAKLDRFFVSNLPGYVGPFPGGLTPPYGLAEQRQFDLANRTLHRGRFRVHWLLREDMDLSLATEVRREHFHASYGLRDRNTQHANLQGSWRPRPSVEAHVFYGFEWRFAEMGLINELGVLSDDANAGGPFFPRANAWTQRSRTRGHHAGSGVRWRPHSRVEFSIDYRLHHARDSIRYDFASVGALSVGVSASDAGDRFSDLRYRDHVLESQLRIELMDEAAFRVFHRYERSFVRDYAQRGLTPNFADRAVILAHQDRDYQAHVIGVMAQLRF